MNYIILEEGVFKRHCYNGLLETATSLEDAHTIAQTTAMDYLKFRFNDEADIYYDNDIPEEYNNKCGILIVDKEKQYINIRIHCDEK
jgi:hypothetical protein